MTYWLRSSERIQPRQGRNTQRYTFDDCHEQRPGTWRRVFGKRELLCVNYIKFVFPLHILRNFGNQAPKSPKMQGKPADGAYDQQGEEQSEHNMQHLQRSVNN